MISRSSQLYIVLGIALFLGSFGFDGLFVFLICILCLVGGFCYVIYGRGEEKCKELTSDFDALKDFKFRPGIGMFLKNRNRFNDKSIYEQIHSMTNSPGMDAVLEQLSEISPRPDDFIVCLENSNSLDELEAIYKSVQEEKMVLRGKDSGGDQGVFVKQQLSSLDFVDGLIKKRLIILANSTVDNGGLDVARALCLSDDGLVQLPLHVVLTNGVAVSYFIDYLQTVGGQNYIDFYLAIEGFKVSVEHQLRTLSNGETVGEEVYETIKEAAQFMYQQYLSQEVVDVLRTDEHFYPGFKKSPLYAKMLAELGITNDDDRPETPASDAGSAYSPSAVSAVSDQERRSSANENYLNFVPVSKAVEFVVPREEDIQQLGCAFPREKDEGIKNHEFNG
ncbi:regulator of G protein signaling domain protein [Ancylostoma ceylanicum]|uniref:Regulator of G protein signaling domain protein n=1 Tax=Ancylostoma ceylanicum TaxID=53326 RepID=A0A0D6LF81_9BILA|nr:regulator of G protein signaling domain protein [Ancylostoma ceylanicum]